MTLKYMAVGVAFFDDDIFLMILLIEFNVALPVSLDEDNYTT